MAESQPSGNWPRKRPALQRNRWGGDFLRLSSRVDGCLGLIYVIPSGYD